MENTFKLQLQRAISLAGLTQKQLAEKAGITEAAVSHYLKGDRTPRAAVASKMAEVLGCSLEYLLGAERNKCNIVDFEDLMKIVARSKKQLSRDEKFQLAQALLTEGDECF